MITAQGLTSETSYPTRQNTKNSNGSEMAKIPTDSNGISEEREEPVMEEEREQLLSSSSEDEGHDTDKTEDTGGETHCGLVKRLWRSWPVVELQEVIKLAVPTVLMLFFQQMLYIVAVVFAGHISGNSRELDAASLAISVSNVTGFAMVIGLASAADTLCPQNFGSKNYKRVGEVFQQGVIILSIAALPVVAIWLNSESILLWLQQPPCVVRLTAQFLWVFTLMLPPLIGMTMLQKYLQAQSVVWVFAATGLLLNVLNIAFCALFTYGLHLGVYSVSVSMVLAGYISLFALVVYIKVRGLHKLTWGGWSIRSLEDWWKFLKLGVPGFLMIAFEWWIYEISLFVSGSLSETELGVNTILLQLLTLMFMFTYGTGTAATVRVGNELGAGNTQRARRASYVALALQFVLASIFITVIGLLHNVIGRLFTSDEDVIAEASYSVYAAMAVIFFDQIQGTISGVFRGAGLQVVAASINFVVFYLIGLPAGICLALLTNLGTMGMWLGLAFGTASQASIYLVILFTLNWNELTRRALKNVRPSSSASSIISSDNSYAVNDESLQGSPTHQQAAESLGNQTDATTSTLGADEAVGMVSYSDNEEQAPLTEKGDTETGDHEKSAITDPLKRRKVLEQLRRKRAKLFLCRGLTVLVSVCLVLISALLAGLFRHQELDEYCESMDNCCSSHIPTVEAGLSTIDWIAPSTVLTSCVCSISTYRTIAPTPVFVV